MQDASYSNNLGPRRMIDKNEYIRLIEQALFKLGYQDVARSLEEKSGIQMQPVCATEFQQHLLAGNWDDALKLLPSLLQNPGSNIQPGFLDDELRDARFLIRQQQYLEAVERGDTGTALTVLRQHLAPLAGQQHTTRLHHLAGLLLQPRPPGVDQDTAAATKWAEWLGGGSAHRSALLAQMQATLPPWLMLPEGRLEVLLEQALETQMARCPYHNLATLGAPPTALTDGVSSSSMMMMMSGAVQGPSGPTVSLLTDYQAGVESLPSHCIQVLEGHTDEVWHLAFSHSGSQLASASKDGTVILWSVEPPPYPSLIMRSSLASLGNAMSNGNAHAGPATPQLGAIQHTLEGHQGAVLFVSWSPDDKWLLSISDAVIRLWEAATGKLRHTYTHHKECVMCCAWMPDSRQFVSGSVDRTIALLDIDGREVSRWKKSYRVQDLAVRNDGKALIIAASDKQIHILRLSDQREVTLSEQSPITSINLSSDSRFVLANLQNQSIHLWTLGQIEAGNNHPALPVAAAVTGTSNGKTSHDPLDKVANAPAVEYKQPGVNEQGRFVVRSSFGGAAGTFVVTGSESGAVYIFHRDSGHLLLKLDGHTSSVNACAWPLATPQLLATASDDRTVRLWLSESALTAHYQATNRNSRRPSGWMA